MRLHSFPGGLRLTGHKDLVTARAIRQCPTPEQVVIPLSQHVGPSARAEVTVGQRVRCGERIAGAIDGRGAAIHASTSGTVVAVEDRPIAYPSGFNGPCIVIASDGLDEWLRSPAISDWQATPRQLLLGRIREAGILGLGGAGFPTAVKLATPRPTLVINGAECEPYIACDDMLLRERADEVILGTRVLRRVLDAERVVFAIEDRMTHAQTAVRDALSADADIELVEVPTIYPEGGERQLIKMLTGLEVPSGGLPLDLGIVVHNVGTAAAVARAVLHGEALVSRLISVTGAGVRAPLTLEVRFGTPLANLVEQAGGYHDDAARLVVGGPMMGIALATDAIPATATTNCLLVLTTRELRSPQSEMPCIRCGECQRVCPAQLLPQQLHWAIKAQDWEGVAAHALFDCIECGCCAQVCPSHIPLVDWYRYAKTELRVRDRDRAKADIARTRFEQRNARLQRDEVERTERLAGKRDTGASATESMSPVQAAIARAQARAAAAASKVSDEKADPDA